MENINNKNINNKFNIYIFDLDNTLINTTARVKIGDSYYNSQEFNRLDLHSIGYLSSLNGPGIDYSEFDSLDQLLKEPIIKETFNQLINAYNSGSTIYILTARYDAAIIQEWLLKNQYGSMVIPLEHILTRANTSACPGMDKMSAKDFKRIQFYKLLNKFGPVEIHYFEDDFEVIQDLINSDEYHHFKKHIHIHLC